MQITLYRSLRQMEERGWVVESEDRPEPDLDDERRRYYRLTELGRRVALAELERLEGVMSTARSKGFAPSARPTGAGARGERYRVYRNCSASASWPVFSKAL